MPLSKQPVKWRPDLFTLIRVFGVSLCNSRLQFLPLWVKCPRSLPLVTSCVYYCWTIVTVTRQSDWILKYLKWWAGEAILPPSWEKFQQTPKLRITDKQLFTVEDASVFITRINWAPITTALRRQMLADFTSIHPRVADLDCWLHLIQDLYSFYIVALHLSTQSLK